MNADRVTLYHSLNTRSSSALLLLEELGAPYDLQVLNMKAGENRQPAYLAVNPMGKVPAIRHRGALVTEQVAVFLYLADAFPEAGLAPAIGDPLRGPYLRWMVYYGSSFEPAVVDKARGLASDESVRAMLPYGSYEAALAVVNDQLRQGPYLLGERFTAADILWGAALTWTTMFGFVPETPEIAAYVARHQARPAVARVRERDAALAAAQAA